MDATFSMQLWNETFIKDFAAKPECRRYITGCRSRC